MARFLAPHKICLLVLVEAYLDAPPEASHTTLLLDNIATHLLSKTSPLSSDVPTSALAFSSPLKTIPSQRPGCTFYDDFVSSLWLATSLDALHGLITRLQSAVVVTAAGAQSRCSPGSPLGQFIRRSNVEWTRLPFDDTLSLLQAYCAFLSPTWETLTKRNPDTARLWLEAQVDGHSVTAPLSTHGTQVGQDTISVSAGDLQLALGQSIDFLQRRGMRVPAALKTRLQSWLAQHGSQEAGTSSLRHFMSFFEAWRASQYSRALENLHRYFDYSIANKSAGENAEAGGSVKLYYQYALLHLSVLHADFEHWVESQAAMDECIATARENQDAECLTFALSWTLYLRQVHATLPPASPAGMSEVQRGQSAHSELAFLKQRGKDSRQWSLVSSTLLEEAKLELRSGGVTAKAFEHLYQAAHLNIQHNNAALMYADAVFLASLYDRLGQTHTAARHCTAILAVLGDRANLRDVVRAKCRLAYGLALRGLYDDAGRLIDDVVERTVGSLKLQQRAEAFARLTAVLKAEREGNLEVANGLLRSLIPMRGCGDPEFSQHLDTLTAISQRRTTLDSTIMQLSGPNTSPIDRHLPTPDTADIAHHIQSLLHKALVHIHTSRSSGALTLALRAAAAAERSLLVPVLLDAVLALTKILLALREYNGALALCQAASSRASQLTGSSALAVGLAEVAMECWVGIAGQGHEAGDEKVANNGMHTALGQCEKALQASSTLKDCCARIRLLLAKTAILGGVGDTAALEDAKARVRELLKKSADGVARIGGWQ